LTPAAYEVPEPTDDDRARFGGWTTLSWSRVADVISDARFGALRLKRLEDRTAVEQMRLEHVQDLRRRGLAPEWIQSDT
jgi:hypothetical protein